MAGTWLGRCLFFVDHVRLRFISYKFEWCRILGRGTDLGLRKQPWNSYVELSMKHGDAGYEDHTALGIYFQKAVFWVISSTQG